MASNQAPEHGTLIISALLLLALAFSGFWIIYYVRGQGPPWELVPYFLSAAAGIVLLGALTYLRRGRRRDGA